MTKFRVTAALGGLVAAGAVSSALIAQQPVSGAAGVPAAPSPACPANGYAKPWFVTAGDNDGILRGYEVASPCIAKETRDAAEAIGLGRGNPLGVKNVATIRFGATGSIAPGGMGSAKPFGDIDVAISYMIPAIRLTVQAAGSSKPAPMGWVLADGSTWTESAPGNGTHPAPSNSATALAPLIRLTPFGAMLSIIEAEGHAKVSSVGGHTVLSGTSPYDNLPVTVTLDEKHQPIAATVKMRGKVYSAAFDDWKDTWESPYLVIFPAHMRWTLNGRPLAELTVTRFHSNPYVVFPSPTLAQNN